MRSLLRLALLTAVLALPTQAQISGTFTIGGASPDYPDLPSAVVDLETKGVDGDVVFQIRPGTYDAPVEIGPITGASAAAQIRFEAENPSNRPLLGHSSASPGDNFVVRLDGADWITLENLDFKAVAAGSTGRLLVLAGDASNITVFGCEFYGLATPGSDEGSILWSDGDQTHDNLSLVKNTFDGGWKGVDLDAPFGSRPTGLVVTDNTFFGQQSEGINVDADGRVERNTLTDGPSSNTTYRAIVTTGGPANAMEVVGNTIELDTGYAGIDGNGGTTLIANNLIALRVSSTLGRGIYGTGGLVAHNTVRAVGNSSALVLPAGGGSVEVRNNILLVDGAGAVIEDPNTNSILASDDNVLYTSAGTLVEWVGTSYTTLGAWQTASGFDAASLSQTTTFVNVGAGDWDLHLAGASLTDPSLIAPPLAEVTTDADGQTRDPYNPKRGADEGTPLPPLDNADVGGFYAVAGSSPDFADPGEALAALADRGMKGAVTFRIRTGTYTVRESLRGDLRVGPAAADPASALLAIRAANPSSRPTLASGATAGFNWLLRLRGLDHVELLNIDFDASGAGDAGRILVLDAGGDGLGADDVTVTNCTFTGAASGVASEERALVWSEVDGHDRLTASGSTFTDGYAGVFLPSGSGDASPDASFTDNTFAGQSRYGLRGSFGDVVIRGNTISSAAVQVYGMQLGYADGYEVTDNQIALPGGVGTGILLLGPDAGASGDALVANNFVQADRPLRLSTGATGARIVHNTLYANGPIGYPVSTSGSDGIAELTNNVLYSASGKAALKLIEANELAASDGNVFYSDGGSILVAVGPVTAYATLPEWQAASGLDAASGSFDVSFVDAGTGDLHLAGASVGDDALGSFNVPDVPTDIDGDARPWFTYRGADEAAPTLTQPAPYAVSKPAVLGAFAHGDAVNVAWTTLDPALEAGPVRVSVLCPGQAPFVRYASTPNDGQAGFAVPVSLGTHGGIDDQASGCTVEVANVAEPSRAAVSAPFVVTADAVGGVTTRKLDLATGFNPARYGLQDVIKWFWDETTIPTGNVRLSLVCDGRARFVRYASTANDGQASATLPATFGAYDVCRTEVMSIADPAFFGRSAPFEVLDTPLPSIDVLTPSDGEAITMGADYDITWETVGVAAGNAIRILLVNLTDGPPNRLVAQTTNTGTYTWSVPTDLDPTAEYRLSVKATADDGTFPVALIDPLTFVTALTASASASAESLPEVLEVQSARPNPSRGRAVVRVGLPEAGPVEVAVFDAVGRRVAVLASGERSAGWYDLAVEAGDLAPGVYVVRALAGGTVATRTLTVVR